MRSNGLYLVAGFLFCLVAVISLACSTSSSGWVEAPSPTQAAMKTVPQAPAVSIPTPGPTRAIVSALVSVNVRQQASERSPSLEVRYKGDFVRLTGRCSGIWAEIRLESGSGWINGRYLDGDRCKEKE